MAFWKSLNSLRNKHVAGLGGIALALLKVVVLLTRRHVRVSGAERLSGLPYPVIFAFNHNVYAESIIVPCHLMFLTGKKISFLIHWMFRQFPLVGWIMRFIDPVWVWSKSIRRFGRSIYPGRRHEPTVDAAVRRFRSGTSLGIFPEGTRNNNPFVLLRARRGLGEIALRAGATVVPVGIEFPAARRRGKTPALGKMILRVGEPVDIDSEKARVTPAMRSGAGMTRAERGLLINLGNAVNAQVMRALAGLCGKALPR